MCKSPCCDKGELRNIEGNSLSVDCSNCGTVYDLLESADFKKYDSPLRKPIVTPQTAPQTPHEEEEEEQTCMVCDRPLSRCNCGEDMYEDDNGGWEEDSER